MAQFIDLEARVETGVLESTGLESGNESDRDSVQTDDDLPSDEVEFQTPKRNSLTSRSKRILVSSGSESEKEKDEATSTSLRKKKKAKPSGADENELLEELKKTNVIMTNLAEKVKATE